ncbi:hypothetical protein M408DRAFT_296595 [Serendipita vermifera MAFF 305830]|uniref:Uncharacterized protein n=1 Tax=Serendipita vermifera MAFF 305830 TaxID=933852 RepID=A0A0C3BFQ2_SERVB|nr:hypothetical protein M408DRAFT_296595 [Serendipita vermifera MAFF 305830]
MQDGHGAWRCKIEAADQCGGGACARTPYGELKHRIKEWKSYNNPIWRIKE